MNKDQIIEAIKEMSVLNLTSWLRLAKKNSE